MGLKPLSGTKIHVQHKNNYGGGVGGKRGCCCFGLVLGWFVVVAAVFCSGLAFFVAEDLGAFLFVLDFFCCFLKAYKSVICFKHQSTPIMHFRHGQSWNSEKGYH